jgi:hypothetical protein
MVLSGGAWESILNSTCINIILYICILYMHKREDKVMSRLIIDVSGEQPQQIKLLAALQGKTIKSYVLDKIFPSDEEEQSWNELVTLLMPRIEDARNNPPSQKTFEQLTKEIVQSRKTH